MASEAVFKFSLTNIKTIQTEDYSTLLPPLEAVFVDAGSLVCFSTEHVINEQQKKDILNSNLLFQLAADKKYNRFTDPSDWYAFYREVASQIGWITQSFKPFERYVSFPNKFQISDVVIDIFSEVLKLDEGEKKALKDTIESMKKSERALAIFESNSINGNRGNFQILACTVDKNEQVRIVVFGCYFQSSEVIGNYFFAGREKQDIVLQASAEVFVLNHEVYDQVREVVNQKLGNRVEVFITNIVPWLDLVQTKS